MSLIVQFTHPGSEHQPDKDNPNFKSWNQGSHRRKFLVTNGDYVINAEKKTGKLMFWGEWEPPSYVTKLKTPVGNNHFPQFFHIPFLPSEFTYTSGCENTDPFVFGESFKYFCCKQDKQFRTTKCALLRKGSLILFGSTNGRLKEDAFFQLDTVFVISDFIEYDTSSFISKDELNVDSDYYNAVFKMRFPAPTDYSLKFRLYFGATYDKPINGMYSFSPAQIYKDDYIGFPRIKLRNMDYITNNLNAAPKFSDVDDVEINCFWNKIREITIEQGCIEGIKFNYTK